MYLTFEEAVTIIFKHATFLYLSNLSQKLALTQAEMDYQAANMELKIQQYLRESSQEHSVELFADFIMANDIGWYILAPVTISSDQAFSASVISVFRWNIRNITVFLPIK